MGLKTGIKMPDGCEVFIRTGLKIVLDADLR